MEFHLIKMNKIYLDRFFKEGAQYHEILSVLVCLVCAMQNIVLKTAPEMSNGLLFSCGRPNQTSALREHIKLS
jgi:hypothetical protein